MWLILDAMDRLLAPILAYTSNEIWLAMPHLAGEDTRLYTGDTVVIASDRDKVAEVRTVIREL